MNDFGRPDKRGFLPRQDKEDALVVDRLQQQSDVADAALQNEMTAADEREDVVSADAICSQKFVHPWSRGVDHEIEPLSIDDPLFRVPMQRIDAGVLADRRSFGRRRGNDGADEREIVDLRVPIRKPAAKLFHDEWTMRANLGP